MPTGKKVIVVVGYGPGISKSVAAKFGAEGFTVALVARNRERLDAGVKGLKDAGVEAAAFEADAGHPKQIAAAVEEVHSKLGPIQVLLWNAYAHGAGDLTTASSTELSAVVGVPVVGLMSAVQAALPDLKQSKDAAILVTNGGLGLFDSRVDAMAVQWNNMGLSVGNSAKHKLVRVLHEKLKPDGIYVGEVMVLGTVKGTAFDKGNATLDPIAIAEKFWSLYKARTDTSVTFG